MGSLEGVAELVRQAALWVVPILSAVILHEIAHGYVALRLGDDTAFRMGRLTLNPLPHMDLFGTVLMPGFLLMAGSPWIFGYAKPVPVDFGRLRDPRRDMVWVALAGPAMNIALAILFSLLLHRLAAGYDVTAARVVQLVLAGYSVPFLLQAASYAIMINVVLAVFNMLPIPPLDGGRVMVGLLPLPYARRLAQLEPFGFFIVIFLMMTDSLRTVIGTPIQFVLGALL